MGRRDIALRLALSLGLVLGCARYRPEPLDPTRHPAELRGRRLDDPGLLELSPDAGFAVELSVSRPPQKLRVQDLSLGGSGSLGGVQLTSSSVKAPLSISPPDCGHLSL